MTSLIEEEITITVRYGSAYRSENDEVFTVVISFTIGRLKVKIHERHGIKTESQRILGKRPVNPDRGIGCFNPMENTQQLFDGEIYILMRSLRGGAKGRETDTHNQIMNNIQYRIK